VRLGHKVSPVVLVSLVALASLELRETQAGLVTVARKDPADRQDPTDLKDPPDLLGPPDSLDFREPLARRAQLETKVSWVKTEISDHPDNVEQQDLRDKEDGLAELDSLEIRDLLVRRDSRVIRDQLGRRELRVSPDQKVLVVSLVSRDPLDRLVIRGLEVTLDPVETLGLLAELDQLDHKVSALPVTHCRVVVVVGVLLITDKLSAGKVP